MGNKEDCSKTEEPRIIAENKTRQAAIRASVKAMDAATGTINPAT
ncbi:hypothetical protein [Planomicrobium sp. CPCC 101110]|nr:hypothetical protein [Planomicrobium sp. CPCC 101110]